MSAIFVARDLLIVDIITRTSWRPARPSRDVCEATDVARRRDASQTSGRGERRRATHSNVPAGGRLPGNSRTRLAERGVVGDVDVRRRAGDHEALDDVEPFAEAVREVLRARERQTVIAPR